MAIADTVLLNGKVATVDKKFSNAMCGLPGKDFMGMCNPDAMAKARSVYPNTMNTTPVTTAGWCSWTAADVLEAYYLSLFNGGASERFRFSFSPDRDELTVTIVAPEQRGRPGAAPAPSRDLTLTASRIKSTY